MRRGAWEGLGWVPWEMAEGVSVGCGRIVGGQGLRKVWCGLGHGHGVGTSMGVTLGTAAPKRPPTSLGHVSRHLFWDAT